MPTPIKIKEDNKLLTSKRQILLSQLRAGDKLTFSLNGNPKMEFVIDKNRRAHGRLTIELIFQLVNPENRR